MAFINVPLLGIPAVLLLSLCTLTSGQRAPSVNTTLGRILGAPCDGANGSVYLGIPYAAPPVGARRWRVPAPYTLRYPATGLNATRRPPRCPQPTEDLATVSEDCLCLNVWTPASARPASRLPVRVFIHGGSYLTGSGSDVIYDGCQIVTDANVIAVTLNYRLGALGFLGLPELRDDQAPAASRNTTDMVMSNSRGLFSSAISQSGGLDYMAIYSEQDGYAIGELFKTAVGCNATSATARGYNSTRACLLNQTAEAVIRAQSSLPFEKGVNSAVVDGVEWPKHPTILMQEGNVSKVPFIVGTNENEGSLFVVGYFSAVNNISALLGDVTESEFRELLKNVAILPDSYLPTILDIYNPTNYGSWFVAAIELITDSQYLCPSLRAVREFVKAGVRTWAYEFIDAPTTGCWFQEGIGVPEDALRNVPAFFSILNNTHTNEIPQVFLRPFHTGADKPPCNYTREERQFGTFISGMWTSMARTGQPFPARSRRLVAPWLRKYTTWPTYNNTNPQGLYLNFQQPRVVSFTTPAVCELWDTMYLDIVQRGTYYF